MTISQGSRSQLLAKTQSGLGVLATDNYSTIRKNTYNFRMAKGTAEGAEIRADREVADYRHTTRHALGEMEVDLCYLDHDQLLASAMFSPWGSDDISIGTTPQYLSVEDGALDIASYQMFRDMVVNEASIRFNPADIIKTSFNLVGTQMAAPAGSSGGGTPVAASTNKPFDSLAGSVYDNAEESGTELGIVTSLEININNGVNPIFALGNQDAVAVESGRGRITGSVSLYYENATWINRFRQETEIALVVNVEDPDGQGMEFRMARVKLNDGGAPVVNEQSRIITAPFVALKPASASALKITKYQV